LEVDFVFLEAGCQAAKVFEFGKTPLNPVALFVQRLVVEPWRFTVRLGRDDGRGSARFDVLHNGIRIIAFVG
jgi:hypothetical protein